LTVIYLPYRNYCDVPEGTTFPAKNVEVQLCTMPGLAMLKDARVKKHEESPQRDVIEKNLQYSGPWHTSSPRALPAGNRCVHGPDGQVDRQPH
jgi:hypothetical protein